MSVQYWGFLALSFAHSDSPDFFDIVLLQRMKYSES